MKERDLAKEAFNDGHDPTAPVGSYPRGASWTGCLDLAGNVYEWCEDLFGSYAQAPLDGSAKGSAGASRRVFRGGSWSDYAWNCRSAYRVRSAPGYRYDYLGFRPARSLP